MRLARSGSRFSSRVQSADNSGKKEENIKKEKLLGALYELIVEKGIELPPARFFHFYEEFCFYDRVIQDRSISFILQGRSAG
jgi:hypothetical protein